MTDDAPQTALLSEQAARAEALATARAALADDSGTPLSHGNSLPKRFGVVDLIDVAEWVVSGKDPMQGYHTTYADEAGQPKDEGF